MRIRIEYCVACGHLTRAVGLAEQILAVFKGSVDVLELVPSTGGRFEVLLNGATIHSRQATGKFPEWSDIESMLKAA